MLTTIPLLPGLCWWNTQWVQGEGLWMIDDLALKVPLGLHHFPAHPPHYSRWELDM